MPELPDITVYCEALDRALAGSRLEGVRLGNPFLLRSVEPPLDAFAGLAYEGSRRLGKRIALGFSGERFLVLHLMIAGRLHWKKAGAALPGKRGSAAFDFDTGTLVLTEAGTKKRASLHAVGSAEALAEHDPGGLELADATAETFAAALTARNHTLKRAMTDPGILSGIGNAYSDEILYAAGLSPAKRTADLKDDELARLFSATIETMNTWTQRLRNDAADGFPEKVTAFRPEMAVHGKYGKPCPGCESEVQRIRYASNECNYCARCQTGGRLLADRAMSRLLKQDWPRTIDELEKKRG